MASRSLLLLAALVGTLATGCARRASLPSAEDAVSRYATAVQRGDVDSLYGMMSDESRRAMSRDELARVLGEQKVELAQHAAALLVAERRVTSRGRMRYADGEVVSLQLADGAFFVEAASGLPAAARTPVQALGQLRAVLARRSYTGLLRVLSPRTRALLEGELRSLVLGLTEPETLAIDLAGDTATVVLTGGHRVRLRREDGVWHIDDFD